MLCPLVAFSIFSIPYVRPIKKEERTKKEERKKELRQIDLTNQRKQTIAADHANFIHVQAVKQLLRYVTLYRRVNSRTNRSVLRWQSFEQGKQSASDKGREQRMVKRVCSKERAASIKVEEGAHAHVLRNETQIVVT